MEKSIKYRDFDIKFVIDVDIDDTDKYTHGPCHNFSAFINDIKVVETKINDYDIIMGIREDQILFDIKKRIDNNQFFKCDKEIIEKSLKLRGWSI